MADMANPQGEVWTGGKVSAASDAFQASDRYRSYVIWLLFTVYMFNFVDRQILTLLIEPIKAEFKFSDAQLGLLGGLAFALLYSVLGLPIARLADKGANRVKIISASLFLWSLFTALTGAAQSFMHFLIARVAVGIGEAGCSPPAYSLISDYFEPKRRSTAIAIYTMGIYVGVFLGFIVGGSVAQAHGWRAAFWVVGLPGVLLAVVLRLTLREPPRGLSEPNRVVAEPPPMGATFSFLWSKSSFVNLTMAAALHSFVGYGVAGFNAAFLMRSHGLTLGEVGTWSAIATAIGGVAGTYGGGVLADRLARRKQDMRYQLWVPAISTLINVPLALLTYTLPQKYAVLLLGIPAVAIGAMYLGPSFAIANSLCRIRERAMAGALLLLVVNLIGLGLGPLLTGIMSDVFRRHLLETGVADAMATADGLRWSLSVTTCVNLWSAYHYYRACRTLREDIAATENA